MNDQKQKEQIEKLNKLKEKPLPDHIKKSIDEKQKNITKPLNK
jgi:hypothetical protein